MREGLVALDPGNLPSIVMAAFNGPCLSLPGSNCTAPLESSAMLLSAQLFGVVWASQATLSSLGAFGRISSGRQNGKKLLAWKSFVIGLSLLYDAMTGTAASTP